MWFVAHTTVSLLIFVNAFANRTLPRQPVPCAFGQAAVVPMPEITQRICLGDQIETVLASLSGAKMFGPVFSVSVGRTQLSGTFVPAFMMPPAERAAIASDDWVLASAERLLTTGSEPSAKAEIQRIVAGGTEWKTCARSFADLPLTDCHERQLATSRGTPIIEVVGRLVRPTGEPTWLVHHRKGFDVIDD